MRQLTQKRLISVSAYNPNPQWPEGYFDVLHEAGVHRDFFQLYANWVRSFFAKNPGRARRSLGAKEIADFLEELGPAKSDSATQRLQAREALILYYEKFRGIPLVKRKRAHAHGHPTSRPTKGKVADAMHRKMHSSSSSTGRLDWTALQTAYLTAIRVENYARSTEKTYWHWIREFLQYHQGRRPSEMGAAEIEAYLGFLAMKYKKSRRSVYAGRLRLRHVPDRGGVTLTGFVQQNVEAGGLVHTDGWGGYDELTHMGYMHKPLVLDGDPERIAAHLPMIHITFSNLKTWLSGTHHGVGKDHLQAYLDEFVFRFNRRFYPMTAFASILGIGMNLTGPTYRELYGGKWNHHTRSSMP